MINEYLGSIVKTSARVQKNIFRIIFIVQYSD